MKTEVTTPQGIFGMPQYLTVPIYQRPYVWTENEQWGPLWADVRRIAEHRVQNPNSKATHFLGAVVTQLAESAPVGVQEYNIVDGQQRLTTLQLLLDATASAFSEIEMTSLEGQLSFLTHNSQMFVGGAGPGLKLRHSNRDRAAFEEVMQAEAPIDYSSLRNRDSLLAKGHEYFSTHVRQWLDEGPELVEVRANALSVALQNALQLVVIGLEASEDSQEIFETLNARGTPLTAADLIKNFVFQRLKLEGEDGERIYRDMWPFEQAFWEEEVSVGRFVTTRSALFLGQWLVSRVGQEVSPRSTFTRFKFFVEHENSSAMAELLSVIAEQAQSYRELVDKSADKHGNLDRLALHIHRASVMQSEITKPVLLWLLEPGSPYSRVTVERVIDSVESWLVRRRLLRLQSSDQGRIAAVLIAVARGTAESELVSVVDNYLASQMFASTYWPGDSELRDSLQSEQFYRRFSQPMQRLVLQVIEDWYRGFGGHGSSKTGVRVHRDRQQVEHILPRSWKTHWPVDGVAAAAEREEHVHRLGNLTLITGSLNSSVSNGPWVGVGGKRAALHKHDVFLMNRRLVDSSTTDWNEDLINARTDEMVEAILGIWKVPDGHVGEVKDRSSTVTKASVTYADLVSAGFLSVGSVLVCTDPRWPDARCEVLAGGRVDYLGEVFPSPAAAARKVRNGSGNAWWFWKVEGGPMLHELRDALLNSGSGEAAPSSVRTEAAGGEVLE